ncbi:O-antigen polymerase [Geodermatophilus tzadiensis]|uniref:O-antigen polymerase n=1 Tax=Geodermatophilus tzadiensis TaxID=1137988 RepID=UPI0011B2210A|nr:O-antigen polymerase [Geodermatophilus tzadiensis]
MPVTLLIAWQLDDSYFRQSWGTAKSLTHETLLLFGAGALLFAIGGMLPLLLSGGLGRHAASPAAAVDTGFLHRCCAVLYRLTVTGYVVLAAVGFSRGARPADLIDALTSQDTFDSTLRTQFTPIAGITTLTQLGIAYVVVAVTLLTRGPDRYVAQRLVVVFVLALMRAFFLTERLAILELAIPAVGILAMHAARGGGLRRRLTSAAPFILVPGAIAVFGVFEYSRSWVFYSQTRGGSFFQFVIDRLAGYYATAYNNGQIALTYGLGKDVRLPYGSIEAFWTAPGISQLDLYGRLTGHYEPDDYSYLLQQYGNPEFNSPGGLSVPFVDYGTAGGLVFFLLVGMALGIVYLRWRDGEFWASLIYPVALTGLLELPRYLYWGQGRVLPAFVALVVIAWLTRRSTTTTGAT